MVLSRDSALVLHFFSHYFVFYPGAFHDNSTSVQHPTVWDFLENWYIGYSSAQKPNLTILDPSEQWFTNYSIGHFCKVVLQYYLLGTFTLILPKPREKNNTSLHSWWYKDFFDKIKHSIFLIFYFLGIFFIEFCWCGQWNKNYFDGPKCCLWYC